MTLGELLQDVPVASPLVAAAESLPVAGLEYDSRRTAPGFVFFAFPGAKVDGATFAQAAVEKGAIAVVGESEPPAEFAPSVPWIQVAHGRRALAAMARRFYSEPDNDIALTGITGTNGKTTTSLAVDAMLRHAGKTTALIGTILYRIGDEERKAVNTTPESLDLMRIFAELRAMGGSHATLEVSSHALALARVHAARFHTAVFTNLTRDHLDFHVTMDAYFEAKQMLFDGTGSPPPRFAVVNADDEWGRQLRIAPETKLLTYGFSESAALRADNVRMSFAGTTFDIRHDSGTTTVTSALTGRFNVYNLLAAFGAGLAFGFTPEQAAAGLAACAAVPGRFERVDEGQPFLVVVDYAHTDDALRNVISAARGMGPKRIITLFGCGGDRDRTKRPLMGEAAARLSDMVVVTSDNPRSEDPLAIINDTMVGVQRADTPFIVEPDRETAIRKAIAEAGSGDVVIIAGKGHETYQILGSRTIDFDDREVARRVLRSLGYSPREVRQ